MKRFLDLSKLLSEKSHFLFGPRASGKSFLIDLQLKNACQIVSLLDTDVYLKLLERPSLIREMIAASGKSNIVIDEIQRIPELLNEVHLLTEKQDYRFLLTGSSARKLKRSNANMLAGRARKAELFPFSIQELKAEAKFDLNKLLCFGGLPLVYLSKDPYHELRDYIDTYLQEEIRVEAGVRNLANFSRFLKVAALSNAEIINYSKMGNDAQVHGNTIREYFQILQDTLLAFIVEPWQMSKKRKAVQTAKFYFFDTGIANALINLNQLTPGTSVYGKAFEQLIALELRAYKSYLRLDDEICFWRTKNQHEVDFIIGDHTAIEVKASSIVSPRDQKSLLKLKEEGIIKNYFIVSNDPVSMKFDSGIQHLPLNEFVNHLWGGQIF
ncbi:MAG: ATP-binding protein [Pseudomonadota bacterium]